MKFDNALAEAAYAIANHGFKEDFVDESGWNALVFVSPTVLLNVDEFEVRQRFITENGLTDFHVWIREDESGFVGVVSAVEENGAPEYVWAFESLERAFDEQQDKALA